MMGSRNSNKPKNLFQRAAGLIAAAAFLTAGATAHAQMSMLRASGTNIVNASGQTVPLRGVNLGGWFIMEKWMAPLDSGSLPDTYSVIQTLDNRFGVATEQSLINAYQQAWMTTTDLDNIKNAGFNVVRVPVWWGQFYPINNVSNASWRSDAFNELDWLVNNCASRGIYVIIDMHGVVGGQGTSDDTGYANQNQYWGSQTDQGNTQFMWWQIASHYNGNPTVAGYDLINEPTGAPNSQAVWNAYSGLYNSIRSADPNHMIFMEGAYGSWNWSALPAPSQYGWSNVVYEMHEYQFNASASQVQSGSDNQVNDFHNHSSWNVPGFIGEFNDFGYGSGVWQYSVNDYNNAGLSWTMWSYKAIHGTNPDSWGYYDPNYMAATPNISSDSASTIQSDWQQWTTSNVFSLNSSLGINGGGVNNGNNTPPPPPPPPASPAPGINSGAQYNLVNPESGNALDVAGCGTANGTNVQTWAHGVGVCNNGGGQIWIPTLNSDNTYTLINPESGNALDVAGCGTANGTNVQIWSTSGTCNSGAGQKWIIQQNSDGTYTLINPESNNALDVAACGTGNGNNVQIWSTSGTCNGGGGQKWQFVAPGTSNAPPPPPPSGGFSTTVWYNIINQNSGQCVDATGWGTGNGTALQQYTCGSQQSNQEWQFTATSGGYYTVTNRNAPSLVWDITGGAGATTPGTPMQLWSYGGGTNQQWMPVSLGGGYYKFVALNDGQCLDTPAASTTPGTRLQQWTCNGATAQSFSLSQQP